MTRLQQITFRIVSLLEVSSMHDNQCMPAKMRHYLENIGLLEASQGYRYEQLCGQRLEMLRLQYPCHRSIQQFSIEQLRVAPLDNPHLTYHRSINNE